MSRLPLALCVCGLVESEAHEHEFSDQNGCNARWRDLTDGGPPHDAACPPLPLA